MRSPRQPGRGAAQLLDALDDDAAVGGQLDHRAHALEEQREFDDLGLHGRALDDRLALGQDGGHQDGLGRADARVGERDAGAVEAGGLGGDAALVLDDLRAHLAQRLEVEVDRAAADRVAADHRHERLARPGGGAGRASGSGCG